MSVHPFYPQEGYEEIAPINSSLCEYRPGSASR